MVVIVGRKGGGECPHPHPIPQGGKDHTLVESLSPLPVLEILVYQTTVADCGQWSGVCSSTGGNSSGEDSVAGNSLEP